MFTPFTRYIVRPPVCLSVRPPSINNNFATMLFTFLYRISLGSLAAIEPRDMSAVRYKNVNGMDDDHPCF